MDAMIEKSPHLTRFRGSLMLTDVSECSNRILELYQLMLKRGPERFNLMAFLIDLCAVVLRQTHMKTAAECALVSS
jgi:hypothetical protein